MLLSLLHRLPPGDRGWPRATGNSLTRHSGAHCREPSNALPLEALIGGSTSTALGHRCQPPPSHRHLSVSPSQPLCHLNPALGATVFSLSNLFPHSQRFCPLIAQSCEDCIHGLHMPGPPPTRHHRLMEEQPSTTHTQGTPPHACFLHSNNTPRQTGVPLLNS